MMSGTKTVHTSKIIVFTIIHSRLVCYAVGLMLPPPQAAILLLTGQAWKSGEPMYSFTAGRACARVRSVKQTTKIMHKIFRVFHITLIRVVQESYTQYNFQVVLYIILML